MLVLKSQEKIIRNLVITVKGNAILKQNIEIRKMDGMLQIHIKMMMVLHFDHLLSHQLMAWRLALLKKGNMKEK